MKKFAFKLLFLMASVCANHVNAADGDVSFESYEKRMHEQKLPLTLIVGCGHGSYYSDGDHTHPDSWCVNLKTDPVGPKIAESTFKADVHYDEFLDIAMFHTPIKDPKTKTDIPVRDKHPKARPIINYKNHFDVVVLERPNSETLRKKPWTLWNALHMLKVGGQLIIDSTHGYNCGKGGNEHIYDNHPLFKAVCNPQVCDYPVNQDEEGLAKFGITKEETKINLEMICVSDYLVQWGLGSIINVEKACQPYTKKPDGDLKEARVTRIFCATKTQETEDKMEAWAQAIQGMGNGRGDHFLNPAFK